MALADKPCCVDTVKEGQLKGRMVELGPMKTYITGVEKPGAAAVLLIPDIYGFSIPNTRFACIGYLSVWLALCPIHDGIVAFLCVAGLQFVC